MAMDNWNNLDWSEKGEWNDNFIHEFPSSDDFGSIYVKSSGQHSESFIPGTGKDPSPFWKMLESGELPNDFDLGVPEFYKSAKPLDFIKHFSMAGNFFGWCMSKKAKAVFDGFNLGYHKFYPFTATKNNEPYEYYLLTGNANDDASIDFSKSSFYFGDSDSNFQLRPTVCNSLQEYQKYMTTREYGNTVYIAARNIILNNQFDNSKDILVFDLIIGEPLFSKRLINAIIENKLTGVTVNKRSNVHLPS